MLFLEFIFTLSIVYVIFNFIWWLLIKTPVNLLTSFKINKELRYILLGIKYFILSNLTYSNCLIHIQKNTLSNFIDISIIYVLGAIFLSLYLFSKLNKKRSILNFATNLGMQSKFNINPTTNSELKYEKHILGISIVIFIACISIPKFGEIIYQNPINVWFINRVQGLYLDPILKGIFGIFGFFFMVSTFLKGIVAISNFRNKIFGMKDKKVKKNPLEEMMNNFNKTASQQNSTSKKVDLDEDLYVDFEEIDDKEK